MIDVQTILEAMETKASNLGLFSKTAKVSGFPEYQFPVSKGNT
jgi:hypothetical protein